MDGLGNFYEELKRRRVIRSATLYVIVLWPIIQVVDIMSPALGLNDTLMRYLVFAFLGGFPLVLVLSWFFDLDKRQDENANAVAQSSIFGNRNELLLMGFLAVFVAGLFIVQWQMGGNKDLTKFVTGGGPSKAVLPPLSVKSYDSIAVLPFAVFSADINDRYFSDGLTEELLNVLAKIKQLKVAARTSSFAYKGVNKNVQEIGRELNVATILEGSVRRNDVDDTIRVTAQLIEVSSGAHLWTKTFDRKFVDIFKIQDEISHAVVAQLKIELLGEAEIEVSKAATESVQAGIAYSLGRTELARRTKQSLQDAERFFTQAVTYDENYAEAYAGLSETYTLMVNYDYADREIFLTKAEQAVDKALQLDSELGAAWAAKGLIEYLDDDAEEARLLLEKAMQLNPNYAHSYIWYANTLHDFDEKLVYFQKAFALDPKSAVAGYNVANVLERQGKDVEAMIVFDQVVKADPYYAKAYYVAARVSERRGRIIDAIAQFEKGYELDADPEAASTLAHLYTDVGDYKAADSWLAVLESETSGKYSLVNQWAKISRFSAENNEAMARTLLLELVESKPQDAAEHLGVAMAAYYSQLPDAVISHYETGVALLEENPLKELEFLRLDAGISAAYAYQQNGRDAESKTLIAELQTLLDKRVQKAAADPSDWYRLALLKSISGEESMALLFVQRAVDIGWREYWRPRFEPALADLIEKPDFKVMLAGLETRLAIIRSQFEMESDFAADFAG